MLSRNTSRFGIHPIYNYAAMLNVYVDEKANQFFKLTLQDGPFNGDLAYAT